MAVSASEKAWAISCYIPVFNVVTCVLVSVRMIHSKFCLFHARQGLVLFAFWFLTIVVALVSQVVSLMLWGVVLLLHVLGVIIALSMRMGQIPFVGQVAMLLPENYFFTLLTGKSVDEGDSKANN